MLIDATHPEETRVVVVRGNRVEEFDYESASRKQLRGNIYLAKVARIEPSLQAAFVNFGGNRHGFLAFAEIHPDYYQIPLADREAMLKEEAAERKARLRQEEADFDLDTSGPRHSRSHRRRRSASRDSGGSTVRSEQDDEDQAEDQSPEPSEAEDFSAAPFAAPEEHEAGAGDHGGEPADAREQKVQPLQAILPAVLYSEFSAAVARGQEAADEIPASEDDVATPEDEERSEASVVTQEPAALTGGGDTEFPEAVAQQEMARSEKAETPDKPGEEESRAEADREGETVSAAGDDSSGDEQASASEQQNGIVETVGSEDALEEVPHRGKRRWRQYKIQEVIKRNQIVLIQVVKEERGTKGAALTTYLSLAGRYTVLMPNTASGGGISRKITNPVDRKRLKEIAHELEVPEGMGLIIRTAGASRTKAEIKRDFEYLLRLWENVRDLTLKSTAPALVYEEGDLIRRSIRDLYNKDIDEVLVAGDNAYREAKDFMRMLMPSHAKNVQIYKDPEPLFTKYEVERQLNQMFSPVVTLRSGGYIVLNQTEALVAIDVNSGRSTREYSIEDTALKTNQEAAEEIARQVRLRDLAGLIVIDFIDMDERRNNRTVERRLKECLRHDRARIQVGHISHFGLLEMSRQRLRQGVVEVSTIPCPMCQGVGTIRSTESVALMILRAIEDHLRTQGAIDLTASCSVDASLYILNFKRTYLHDIETRYGVAITVNADAKVHGAHFSIERGTEATAPRQVDESKAIHMDWAHHETEEGEEKDAQSDERQRSSRRRRRRRGRGRGEEGSDFAKPEQDYAAEGDLASEGDDFDADEEVAVEASESEDGEAGSAPAQDDDAQARRHRRRGRRGGRRRRGFEGGEELQSQTPEGIPGLGEQPVISADYAASVDTPASQETAPSAEASAEAIAPASAEEAPAGKAEPAEVQAAPEAEAVPQHATEPVATVEEAAPQSEAQPDNQAAEPSEAKTPETEVPADVEPQAPKLEVVQNGAAPKPENVAEEAQPAPRPRRAGPARRGWWQRRMGE